MSFNRMFIPSQKYQILLCTVRPYQVFFYSKILATLLPVIYCKNGLKLKLTNLTCRNKLNKKNQLNVLRLTQTVPFK